MNQALLYFSILFIIVQLSLVLIPYIRQKRDLVSAWSLLTVGSACFVGASGINAARSPYGYTDYVTADYIWFFAGVVVFFSCLHLTYFFVKWPERVAMKRFAKWPPVTPAVLLFIMPIGIIMSFGLLAPIQIQGIGQIMVIVGKNGVIIASIAAFIFWYRQPSNPIGLVLMLVIFLYSFGFSMLSGSGRRDMVAVLAVIPIALYWYRFRYTNPKKTALVISSILVLGILVINGYSNQRHALQRSGDKSAGEVLRTVIEMPRYMLNVEDVAALLGQNAVEVSLLAINVYHTEQWDGFERAPFHAAKFIALNPIPRAFWRDKPSGLGKTLPIMTKLRGGRETWGPGIVGHGFHEGGLHILVVYGIAVGLLLRLFDSLLTLYPGNPYLLAILCANSGQLIGWSRGDIGTFSVQIIGGVIAVWLLTRIVRFFCGTEFMPAGQQYAAQPSVP
ncbi:MAG: hypothetical protein AAGC72_05885 [Planctomycetota bacterium]